MQSGQNNPDSLEIEVKFWVRDMHVLRDRIIDSGATQKGKTFENNIRFDDINGTLMKNRSLLRLRQENNGMATLTHKSALPVDTERFKVFTEREVRVSDADTMLAILNELGYRPVQRYEKWRETFDLNNTLLCLDQMPFGTFIEIEGQKTDIRNCAQILGLEWETRISSNYLALFDRIRQKMGLPFTDVSFKNFGHINIQVDPLIFIDERQESQ